MKSILADVKFGIYYGVSNNKKRFWDISNAESEIDYQPEDDASRLYRYTKLRLKNECFRCDPHQARSAQVPG